MSEPAASSGFDHVAGETPVPVVAGAASGAPLESPPDAPAGIAADDIEKLLRQAERALSSVDAVGGPSPAGFKAFKFEELAPAATSQDVATLELLRDVELDLKIELGRTHMYLEEVLKLRKGSVVALDKLAGDPVDIFVNGRLIARGEVLVLNDNFCVRVAELVAGEGSAV
ncbi:MAG TPA: flagellar motor switch protein FliN [Pirellulales bacterium]